MPPKNGFEKAGEHCVSWNRVGLPGKEDAEEAKKGGGQGARSHKAAIQQILRTLVFKNLFSVHVVHLYTIILYQPSELSPTDMPCLMIHFPQGDQGGLSQAEENISDSKNHV